MIFFRNLAMITLLMVPTLIVTAQPTGYLEVVGSVQQLGKNLEGATITVMRGNEQVDLLNSNSGGRFIVNLDLNSAYTIQYSKKGSFSKSVDFDTRVPKELEGQIFSLKYKIDLIPNPENAEEPESLQKAVAKYAFSDMYDDFTYDPNYTTARKVENEKIKQEVKVQLEKQRQEEAKVAAKARADSLTRVNDLKAEQAKLLAEEAKRKKEEEAKAKELEREQMRLAAIEKARQDSILQRQVAEEQARLKAEAKAKADSIAKAEVEERARLAAEEKARKEAEAVALAAARERERLDAVEKARKEAEEKERLAAEEKARKEAEEKARVEADAQAKREAEEKSRIEAEARAKAEADERARLAAEAKARKEAEEKARLDADAKARAEAESRANAEAEEKARLLAEEKARFEAQKQAKMEADSLAKAEEEARLAQADAVRQQALKDAEEKRRRDIEAQKEALAKTGQMVRDTTKTSPTASSELPEVVKDYPEGISEETITENNRTIYRTILKKSTTQEVFSKVVYNWGGVYYFKGNTNMTEANFNAELRRFRESLENK